MFFWLLGISAKATMRRHAVSAERAALGEVRVRLAAERDEVRCGLARRALGKVDLAVAGELDDEVQRVEVACRRVAFQVEDDPMVPELAGGVASELKQLVLAGDDKVPRCRHARVQGFEDHQLRLSAARATDNRPMRYRGVEQVALLAPRDDQARLFGGSLAVPEVVLLPELARGTDEPGISQNAVSHHAAFLAVFVPGNVSAEDGDCDRAPQRQ